MSIWASTTSNKSWAILHIGLSEQCQKCVESQIKHHKDFDAHLRGEHKLKDNHSSSE